MEKNSIIQYHRSVNTKQTTVWLSVITPLLFLHSRLSSYLVYFKMRVMVQKHLELWTWRTDIRFVSNWFLTPSREVWTITHWNWEIYTSCSSELEYTNWQKCETEKRNWYLCLIFKIYQSYLEWSTLAQLCGSAVKLEWSCWVILTGSSTPSPSIHLN